MYVTNYTGAHSFMVIVPMITLSRLHEGMEESQWPLPPTLYQHPQNATVQQSKSKAENVSLGSCLLTWAEPVQEPESTDLRHKSPLCSHVTTWEVVAGPVCVLLWSQRRTQRIPVRSFRDCQAGYKCLPNVLWHLSDPSLQALLHTCVIPVTHLF